MKTYNGWINAEGETRVNVEPGRESEASGLATIHPLAKRPDIYDYAPTYAWGQSGSQAAQLALDLCADMLGDDNLANRYHQALKRTFIAGLNPNRPWSISDTALISVLRAASDAKTLALPTDGHEIARADPTGMHARLGDPTDTTEDTTEISEGLDLNDV